MKKVLADTNILVDLIADRKPYSKFAVELFSLAERGHLKLYVSSHAIATTHYVLQKYVEEKKLRELLLNLLDFVTVIPIDGTVLRKGLRSKYRDFEDGLQIICASSVDKMDCIVTRNIRDFRGSVVPVLSPDAFLSSLQ